MYKAKKFTGSWAVMSDRSGLVAQGMSCSAAMLMASRLNWEDIQRRIKPACGNTSQL